MTKTKKNNHNEEIIKEFLIETTDSIEHLNDFVLKLETNPKNIEVINEIFRIFHSIKGTASFLNFKDLVSLCHKSENIYDALRSHILPFSKEIVDLTLSVGDEVISYLTKISSSTEASINQSIIDRINIVTCNLPEKNQEGNKTFKSGKITELLNDKTVHPINKPTSTYFDLALDAKDINNRLSNTYNSSRINIITLNKIMNLIGELTLVRNRIAKISSTKNDEGILKASQSLNFITNELQASMLEARLQAVDMVFRKVPRLVRDLADKLNKKVTVKLIGENTKLDKNLIDMLSDPIFHMVRNCLDHGIESQEKRQNLNKETTGTIVLKAESFGNEVIITISDDGSGIDTNILKQKAIEKQILTPMQADKLSEEETFDLIFAPGFSTCSNISDISGRGVGMDVVREKITQLSGSISVESTVNKGTKFILRLPSTLAILVTLMVRLNKHIYALPITNVVEILDCESLVKKVNNQYFIEYQGKYLNLVTLENKLFDTEHEIANDSTIIVLKIGGKLSAVSVDEILTQEEVIVKPISAIDLKKTAISGSTITSDGEVALIIDVASLL